jgi:hypothetical protein
MMGAAGNRAGTHVWMPLAIAVICLVVWAFGWGLSGRRGRPTDLYRQAASVPAVMGPTVHTNRAQYATDMDVNLPAKAKSDAGDNIFAKPDRVIPDPGDEEILL